MYVAQAYSSVYTKLIERAFFRLRLLYVFTILIPSMAGDDLLMDESIDIEVIGYLVEERWGVVVLHVGLVYVALEIRRVLF